MRFPSVGCEPLFFHSLKKDLSNSSDFRTATLMAKTGGTNRTLVAPVGRVPLPHTLPNLQHLHQALLVRQRTRVWIQYRHNPKREPSILRFRGDPNITRPTLGAAPSLQHDLHLFCGSSKCRSGGSPKARPTLQGHAGRTRRQGHGQDVFVKTFNITVKPTLLHSDVMLTLHASPTSGLRTRSAVRSNGKSTTYTGTIVNLSRCASRKPTVGRTFEATANCQGSGPQSRNTCEATLGLGEKTTLLDVHAASTAGAKSTERPGHRGPTATSDQLQL